MKITKKEAVQRMQGMKPDTIVEFIVNNGAVYYNSAVKNILAWLAEPDQRTIFDADMVELVEFDTLIAFLDNNPNTAPEPIAEQLTDEEKKLSEECEAMEMYYKIIMQEA